MSPKCLIPHCSELCIVIHTLPVSLAYYNGKILKDKNCHMTQGEEEPNRKTLQGWFCDKGVRTRLALNTTLFLSMDKSFRLKPWSHWSLKENILLYLMEKKGLYSPAHFTNVDIIWVNKRVKRCSFLNLIYKKGSLMRIYTCFSVVVICFNLQISFSQWEKPNTPLKITSSQYSCKSQGYHDTVVETPAVPMTADSFQHGWTHISEYGDLSLNCKSYRLA